MPEEARASSSRGAKALDLGERFLIIALYSWLVVRLLTAYGETGVAAYLATLLSEGLILFFTLIRRNTEDISRRFVDWFLALGATAIPLTVQADHESALVNPATGLLLIVLGLVIQLHAKLILARSFGIVAANRGLKFRGPYRFLRHPMYAGYLVSHLGFLAGNFSLYNLGAYLLLYLGFQIPRILVEERHLSSDPEYREYMSRVRFRMIPGLF